MCADKVGLIVNVVEGWPDSSRGITDSNGNPYATVHELVQVLVDCPTPFIPMGCPTPDKEGRCPGHES